MEKTPLIETKTLAWTTVLAMCVFVATPASASVYFDGASYLNFWEGQTSFTDGASLNGYVNWIVYGPGSSPYSGYTPQHSGEYTYVLQLFSTGTDQIHYFSTELDNAADSISALAAPTGGKAAPGGIAPSGMSLQQWYTTWEFTNEDIGQNQHSELLVFSSPDLPTLVVGDVMDGTDVTVDPVPGPGTAVVILVPEPTTLSLALVGFGCLATAWAMRLWQRKTRR